VDRRRFDETGELRPDRPEPEAKPSPPPREPEPKAPPPAAPARAGETGSDPAAPPPSGADPGPTGSASPLFLDLIAGLAQQAEILMTGAQGLPAQPAEAQRVIEYLSMLEAKTKGNLSSEEQQVLSSVIFQLRTLYVQHKP
jgi:hypothetical protein